MKIKAITSVFAATATAGIMCAPLAGATETTTLGGQATLTDGAVVQGWTVTNLQPSSDVIPHPVSGQLWEVTATDKAIQGSATPIVSNFNARTQDGQTYRALFGAATPQGVNPATLAQGQETSGKIYFDVTGAAPDSVVYNAGGVELAVWTKPAPAPAQSSGPSSYPSGYASQVPAAVADAIEEEIAESPAEEPAAAPAGSQGTPIAEGSQGTPLPASTQTTPAPAGTQPTAVPAGTQNTTAPGDQAPTPTTYTPAPTP